MEIKCGEKIFEFVSFDGWVAKADKEWRRRGIDANNTLCVDQTGRICLMGRDFMIARDENSYPVEVFMARPELVPNNEIQGA